MRTHFEWNNTNHTQIISGVGTCRKTHATSPEATEQQITSLIRAAY